MNYNRNIFSVNSQILMIKLKSLLCAFPVFLLNYALLLSMRGIYSHFPHILTAMISEVAAVEILKFQETQKQFAGTYDQFLLSTKTSGWTNCKQYAASLWIKKVSWYGSWETYMRISHAPT